MYECVCVCLCVVHVWCVCACMRGYTHMCLRISFPSGVVKPCNYYCRTLHVESCRFSWYWLLCILLSWLPTQEQINRLQEVATHEWGLLQDLHGTLVEPGGSLLDPAYLEYKRHMDFILSMQLDRVKLPMRSEYIGGFKPGPDVIHTDQVGCTGSLVQATSSLAARPYVVTAYVQPIPLTVTTIVTVMSPLL